MGIHAKLAINRALHVLLLLTVKLASRDFGKMGLSVQNVNKTALNALLLMIVPPVIMDID